MRRRSAAAEPELEQVAEERLVGLNGRRIAGLTEVGRQQGRPGTDGADGGCDGLGRPDLRGVLEVAALEPDALVGELSLSCVRKPDVGMLRMRDDDAVESAGQPFRHHDLDLLGAEVAGGQGSAAGRPRRRGPPAAPAADGPRRRGSRSREVPRRRDARTRCGAPTEERRGARRRQPDDHAAQTR